MATTLVSPGVQVTVVDQSQYLPAATSSVPLVLLATAQNKVSGTGTGVAAGTLAVNANKMFLATSQRSLLSNYGVPFFYTTTAGTPINGYELNEYGLLAAYSALGVTNQCYILRADIDLAALSASLTRPTGTPNNGTYWLNTATTAWGLFQWNQATGAFNNQVPSVITSTTNLVTGSTVPLQSYGSIGQYAVVATAISNPVYYKRGGATAAQTSDETLADLYNTWVLVGSNDWQTSWPAVTGAATPATLTAGDTFLVNGTIIEVPNSPYNTVRGVADAIYAAGIGGVHAANINGALALFIDSTSASIIGQPANGQVTITKGSGDAFYNLGFATSPVTAVTYYAPQFQASANYTVPNWNTYSTSPVGGAPTGSIWQKTTNVNLGTNIVMSKYNSTLGTFVTQSCTVYSSDATAIYGLDPSGGGGSIAVGTTYAQADIYNQNASTLSPFERYATGSTVVTGTTLNPTFVANNTFNISATQPGTANYTTTLATVLSSAGTTAATASDFVAAVSAASIPYVSASINSAGAIVITHSSGGDIVLTNVVGTPVTTAGFTSSTFLCRANYVNNVASGVILSNWIALDYTPSATAPDQDPADGTYWYYSDATQADIMVLNNGAWYGYQNVTLDSRGYNLSLTNALGPIASATAPTTQNNTAQSPLVYGDLWIDTGDLENYPALYRWQNVSGTDQWVKLSNTDTTQSNGMLFADARWAPNGTTDPVADPIPPIATGTTPLITSNYLDLDAPNPGLYPNGILLWNTRRSGFNVKTYQSNYFTAASYPNDTIPAVTSTWLTASGNRSDGSPYMGRQSQRAIIVKALKSALDTNTSIREEQNQFQLIACPQYPELAANMVALNNERGNTGFAVVDTPLRLTPEEVVTWATNNNGLGLPTGDGRLTSDSYSAAFYPSCQTTDLSGNLAVTAPSHMMLRTIIRSDNASYPWLAPAGTSRGTVDNATQIGYVDAVTGTFTTLGVNQGLRDVLYENQVNPITYIPGTGITNFGNKTLQGTATAMDRINVARLVAFIRGRLSTIAKQYLFEPNDNITRNEIKNSIDSLMIDLVSKRGIYDYLVVCDTSNNTPATIDANQLWVDIAIEPVKAVEFIYIPMRIQNTGSIAAQAAA
jgi:hypothetical protein